MSQTTESEFQKRLDELKKNLAYLKQESIKNVIESGLELYDIILDGDDINELYLVAQIRVLFMNSIERDREYQKTINLLNLLDENKQEVFKSIIQKLIDTLNNEPNKTKCIIAVSDLIYEIFFNLPQKQPEKRQNCIKEKKYLFTEIQNVKFNPQLALTTFSNKFNGSKTLDLLNQLTNEDKKTVIKLLKELMLQIYKRQNGYSHRQNYQYPNSKSSNEDLMLLDYFEGYIQNNSKGLPKGLKSYEKDILSVVEAIENVIQKRSDTEKFIKEDMFCLIKEYVNDQDRLSSLSLNEIYDQLEGIRKRNGISDLKKKIGDNTRDIEEITQENENIEKQIQKIHQKLLGLNDMLKEGGYYASEEKKINHEIVSFKEQIKLKDEIKVQNIAIPFESWFFEEDHEVIIHLSPKKKIRIHVPLKQSMKNGQIISYGKIVLRLNFTHPHFRREGNDVIYYLHEKDINRDYRNSVKPLSKPIVNYTYNEFRNNEIIVQGGGFKDGNEVGSFILRKIEDKQQIPLKENVLVDERLDDEMKYLGIKQKLYQLFKNKKQNLEEKKTLEEQEVYMNKQISDRLNKIKLLKLEIEGLTNKINEIEQRIEEEKINGTDVLQKKIIGIAIEEKRIVQADPIPQSRRIVFVEEKDGCCTVKVGNENIIVSSKGKNNLSRIEVGPLSRRTMYVKKIGEYPFEDVSCTTLINDVLKKDNGVLIFDVNIPRSYDKPIYPVVPCFRNAFGLKENGPMIFPINIGKTAQQHVFVNGYFSGNKEDGIIIINTKFVDESEIQMCDDDFDLPPMEEEKQSPKHDVSGVERIDLNESSSGETKMDCDENEKSKSDTESVRVEDLPEEKEENDNPKQWECTRIKEGKEEIYVCEKGGIKIALRMTEKPSWNGFSSSYNHQSKDVPSYPLRSVSKEVFKKISRENKNVKEFPLVLPKEFEKKEGKFIGLELGSRKDLGLTLQSHLPLIVRIPLDQIEPDRLHRFEIGEGIFVFVRIHRE